MMVQSIPSPSQGCSAAGLVLWVGQRFQLSGGRLVAVYAMAYTAGRVWIESLRIDTANHLLGLRLKAWTCEEVFAAAATYVVLQGRRERRQFQQTPLIEMAEPS